MSTIFNKIIRGEIPAHIIYEDDSVIAFLDISQATVGHTLVVPKGRYENIYDLDDEIAGHLYRVVVLIANGIKKSLKPEGINILNNNGSIAGQTVFHYHIHIIPRYSEKDIEIKLTNNYGKESNEELRRRTLAIQAALSETSRLF